MTIDVVGQRLGPFLSRERTQVLFQELVRVPSPQTDLLEGEPQLRKFMQVALMPRMGALGMSGVRQDAMGNLIAELGNDTSGRSMMLVTHAMNQPPSTMPDPYGGTVIDATAHGLPGEAVLGKGASEQKGTMAAMLHAIEAVRAAGIDIEGRLYFICCVSGETGKHDAIRNVVEQEGVRADLAFVYGNSLKLQLGNRGRVDVKALVRGLAGHSSRPNDGANAVTGAHEFLRRLALAIPNDRKHPLLGTAWLTCNRIESWPKSTHTVQDRCEISLDRRLLPGEDPDEAVAEIAAVAATMNGWPDPVSGKPLRVEVEKGPMMYPSLVTEEAPVVRLLSAGCVAMLGMSPETFYGQSAHDQGYLNAVGISTANFGSGEQAFAHTDLDMASVDKTFEAAKVYAWMIASYLGKQ
ncbi:MAG: acetylornithine deacetylase/succinyldiaminopimelate desuccinylase-like deacylase [Bradyrhizobium sp.]|nr:acetylornithine deacetylase/succinyldiaminopimelate desuccinylase-like deacylase [Bradyrhizobium sp.]